MSDCRGSRRNLFVDPKIQGPLVIRVILYWIVCLIVIGLMLLSWRILTGPAQLFRAHLTDLWSCYATALMASLLLLPLVVIDSLRFSNRFVGPLLRLRRSMRQLARGELVQPIRFRDHDLWQDLAEEFNAVLDRVQKSPCDTAQLALTQIEPGCEDDEIVACA